GACGAAVGKIGFEDIVHAAIVLDAGKIDGELEDGVHGAPAGFDDGLNAFHDALGVIGDVLGKLRLAVGVRTDSRDVDDAIMNDEGRDEALVGRLALEIELLYAAGRLRGSGGGIGKQTCGADSGEKRG